MCFVNWSPHNLFMRARFYAMLIDKSTNNPLDTYYVEDYYLLKWQETDCRYHFPYISFVFPNSIFVVMGVRFYCFFFQITEFCFPPRVKPLLRHSWTHFRSLLLTWLTHSSFSKTTSLPYTFISYNALRPFSSHQKALLCNPFSGKLFHNCWASVISKAPEDLK